MGSFSNFLTHMDWEAMVTTLISALAALLCLTVHELCHGLAAWRLGDPTAKNAGRLTLNPIRHLDPLGLLLMVFAHVGWAKPVPVDPRYFKRPKQGMALTALAGPMSNFALAWLLLLAGGGLERLRLAHAAGWSAGLAEGAYWAVYFLAQAAILSVGLGLFNLIPIPPLDGSKVLFSFFPDRIYAAVLRYERYVMLAVFLLVWTGVLSGPLTFLISRTVNALCTLSFFPYPLF